MTKPKRPLNIYVDLDGTLAHYSNFGEGGIGLPIAPMVDRVKRWLSEGHKVVIFTARMSHPERGADEEAKIRRWCKRHIGADLQVTCIKSWEADEFWDDRAVTVETNTGRALAPSRRGLDDPLDNFIPQRVTEK